MTVKHIWSGGWEAESEEDARRRAEAEAERLGRTLDGHRRDHDED